MQKLCRVSYYYFIMQHIIEYVRFYLYTYIKLLNLYYNIYYVGIWMIIAFLSILLLAIVVAWFKDVHVKEGKQVKLFTLRLCIDYGTMAHACHIPFTQCFCGTM